jgi:hypothetical protein
MFADGLVARSKFVVGLGKKPNPGAGIAAPGGSGNIWIGQDGWGCYWRGFAAPGGSGLFMVPGMFHCRGGIGTDRLDAMTALINWVENGTAPAAITASQVDKGKPLRTRPLCPYPQVACYAGSGSPDDAANFACKAPD